MLKKARKSLNTIKSQDNIVLTRQQRNKLKGGTGSQDVIDL